jgi:hypothetical protein
MRYRLLLLLLIPCLLHAQQSTIDKGTITIDLSKKKKQAKDTTGTEQQSSDEEETLATYHKQQKQEKQIKAATNDYKKDGIFSGLFHAGLNMCQVDGDRDYGYKYFGAELGIGAMARVHRLLSVSLELNYSMKGANSSLINPMNKIEWDYIAAPIALNVHWPRWLIISGGIAPSVMVRYREHYDGINITAAPAAGQPSPFDMCVFGGLHLVLKEHYAIGAKFSYSMLKLRPALDGTRVSGQYNNVITVRFMYILHGIKPRKK